MAKKERNFYIFSFLFFFILFCLSPISGDDWGNYIAGSNGLYHSIGNAVGMYFSWEGRFVSRILINVLTYHKFLWNIVNSLAIVLLFYLAIKIINPKRKRTIYLLLLLLIPLMNIYMFSQTMTWLAGNITYFLEIPLMLLYFYMLYKKKYDTKLNLFLLILLSISIPMFAEHMAAVLVCGNLILLGYNYYKTKTIDKKLVVLTIISIISMLSMYLSPGTRTRSATENIEFNKLGIFGKIGYNLPNFVYYTFVENYYLLFLFIISNFFLVKHQFKNKFFRLILSTFLTIVPLVTIFLYPLSIVKEFNIINNTYLIIYYLVFSIISFILILREKNKESIFIFTLGMLANCIMLMSPTWGYRTSLFTYIMLGLSSIIIISKYLKEKNVIFYIFTGGTVIILTVLMIFFVNIYRCQKDLEKSIKEQLKEDKEVIDIVMFPNFANCNINPDNDFHLVKYKEYYNIPQDKKINFISSKWHYLIFYKK